MEVNLDPDLQTKLSRIAAARGSKAEILAREAIERFVDYDEWFIREVEKGLASADNGELLSHEEVGVRLEKLIVGQQIIDDVVLALGHPWIIGVGDGNQKQLPNSLITRNNRGQFGRVTSGRGGGTARAGLGC